MRRPGNLDTDDDDTDDDDTDDDTDEASRASHSRLPGRLTRDSRVSGPPFLKNLFFYRKINFFIVTIIGKTFPKFSYI